MKTPTKLKLRMESHALRELVRHCQVHSGYPDCGYVQMDTPMKRLYNKTLGRRGHVDKYLPSAEQKREQRERFERHLAMLRAERQGNVQPVF